MYQVRTKVEREKEAGARQQVQGLWSRESTLSTLSTGREAQHGGTKVGMSNKVWEKARSTNCQACPSESAVWTDTQTACS